ncbi:hypothetical protein [Hyphobacterium sp.]|uniref:hypothetical protein n=1 Tax=Hyphobacterium sp. TaxID=2004662 RepID=UPI003BAC0976
MKIGFILFFCLLFGGCVNVNTLQRSFTYGNSLPNIGLRYWSEEQKNLASRNFFRALGNNTNPSIATAVTSASPRRWRFAQIVADFANRAAVPYRRRNANLLVGFDVLRVEGSVSGPQIRNYEVILSVMRPNSLFEGDQIVGMRSVRIVCTTGAGSRRIPNCDRFIPDVGEALLYHFAATYGDGHEPS